jgi:CheY-like chemotaxis protein
MTILVADDEELVRTVVVRLLEFLGHEVVAVDGGKPALEELRERDDIDLAMLDEQMPDLRGSEVLVQMRTFRPDMPVILSSGNGVLESEDPHALVLGKPYRLDTLETALADITGRG